MIRHICMFKFKDTANGKSKEENIRETIELAQNLKKIPSLINFNVVTNCVDAKVPNYDLSLIFDFNDAEGLNEYQISPIHVAFGKFISQVREERACIDYEF